MSDNELEEILKEFSTKKDSQSQIPAEENKKTEPILPERPVKKKTVEPEEVLSFDNFIEAPGKKHQENDDEYVELDKDDKPVKKNKKRIVIIITALVLVIALGVGAYFLFFHHSDDKKIPETTTEKKEQVVVVEKKEETDKNPLTGEADYNTAAVDKRPVAVVVENEYSTEAVRPQWALSDADIVLEGESEFSTRMLLFWADYTDVPEQVGPARSARPPFIHFSQLFDSIFIHAGLSKSKGNYVGADDVFVNENIDHVNLLAGEGYQYFARDNSRQTAVEHTGYLKGDLLSELIEDKQFRTELDKDRFSVFNFNEEDTKLSDTAASKVEFRWNTKGNCPKKGTYYYDESTKTYKTTDFDSGYGESEVSWKNLIFLLDQTEYIVKENYKNGRSETYCDYKLSGGKGAVLSEGTYVDITWGVDNGKLWMKDANGKEVKLNAGKSYIGYGSENYGGAITIVE